MKKILILLISIIFYCCSGQQPTINGVSFVAAPKEINEATIHPILHINANWAAVMPFGFLKNLQTPSLVFNIENQWWGERADGAKKTIELLNKKGIKVMLKPQIWVWKGEFTGHIAMRSEEDWNTLEKTYTDFIILYARLAEEMNVPLLCIGTELHTFVQKRPKFWHQLITEIRQVYKGALTYAENWDQFDVVPFWDQLEYIGVDAYFPLSDSKTPSVAALRKSWQLHKNKLKALQISKKKPILFTEYGYRSTDYTAKNPWDTHTIEGSINMEAQNNALTALHKEFWQKPWFAGGFLWKWFHNHTAVGGKNDNRFTPQNKPAENIIRSFYEDK